MPTVTFGDVRIDCDYGANLRSVLLDAGIPLYHKFAKFTHCRGLGTCGTCAVKLRGSASWPTKIEAIRLRFPPHKLESGLRLACQCQVHGDLVVEKFGGIWGQDLENPVIVIEHRHRHRHLAQNGRHGKQLLVDGIIFRSDRSRMRSLHLQPRPTTTPRRHVAAMADHPRKNATKLKQHYRSRRALTKH